MNDTIWQCPNTRNVQLTVAELLSVLSKLPPETKVCVGIDPSDGSYSFTTVNKITDCQDGYVNLLCL